MKKLLVITLAVLCVSAHAVTIRDIESKPINIIQATELLKSYTAEKVLQFKPTSFVREVVIAKEDNRIIKDEKIDVSGLLEHMVVATAKIPYETIKNAPIWTWDIDINTNCLFYEDGQHCKELHFSDAHTLKLFRSWSHALQATYGHKNHLFRIK